MLTSRYMFELLAYYTPTLLAIVQFCIFVVIPVLLGISVTIKAISYLAGVVVEELE